MTIAEDLANSQKARAEGKPAPAAVINEASIAEFTGQKAEPKAEEPQATPAPKQEKLRIGDKEFNSMEDALAYAQKLEITSREKEAFELGKESVKQQAAPEPVVVEPSIEEQIQDLLFENPAEALKKYREHIVKEVKSSITTESKAEQEKSAAWNHFYESNPELSEHKDLVEFVLEKNWDSLGNMQLESGLQELAKMAKGKLQAFAKSALPVEALPSGAASVASSGQAAPTSKEEGSPKRLDFATQVRMLNKRQL